MIKSAASRLWFYNGKLKENPHPADKLKPAPIPGWRAARNTVGGLQDALAAWAGAGMPGSVSRTPAARNRPGRLGGGRGRPKVPRRSKPVATPRDGRKPPSEGKQPTPGKPPGTGSAPRSSLVKFETTQVRDKFKHARDFGVTVNSNPAGWKKLIEAMQRHLDAPGTQAIKGTYRGQPVIHHVDPKTGLNVMAKPNGEFISGWRLNCDQLCNVLTRGSL